MLLEHGYNTYMVGKWHLTPSNQETAAGPYDRWPLGRGFQRFYGFLGGDTSQWYPDLVYDNHQVEPPKTPEQGYHLTEDLIDHSIGFIADAQQVDPDKPFLLHLCFGATHAPHHVPAEWSDQVRRQVRRRAGTPTGRTRSPGKRNSASSHRRPCCPGMIRTSRTGTPCPRTPRRLFSRMMEVFAGFLTHTDHHLGRLLEFLRTLGELDNTLIMVVSDNGASAEGGPTGTTNEAQFFNNAQEPLEESLKVIDEIGGPKHFNHYPWGWTWAGNTPFRRWKRETYRGGVSDPFMVSWPAGITAKGAVRTAVRPHHRHGAHSLGPAEHRAAQDHPRCHTGTAPRGQLRPHARRRHRREQPPHPVLRNAGHRAIYHDGWRAVCPWPGPSFAEAGVGFGQPISAETVTRVGRQGLGALPRRRRLRREPQRRRRAP